jgi:hypothetical protein
MMMDDGRTSDALSAYSVSKGCLEHQAPFFAGKWAPRPPGSEVSGYVRASRLR